MPGLRLRPRARRPSRDGAIALSPSKFDGIDQKVLAAIEARAERGSVNVTMTELARWTKLSRRTVCGAMHRLRNADVLELKGVGRSTVVKLMHVSGGASRGACNTT